MRIAAVWPALPASMLAISPASACMLCHSRVADEVRAALLGPDLWTNLIALLAPIPVLFAATIVVRRCTP